MRPSIAEIYPFIKREKGIFALGLFCQISAKALEALLPLLIGLILAPLGDAYPSVSALQAALREGFFIFIPLIFWLFFELGASYLRNLFAVRIEKKFRLELFHHLIDLPLSFFDRSKGGEVATYLSDDVEKIREALADSLIPLIGNIFLSIFVFSLAFYLSPITGTLFFLFFPFTLALFLFFRREQKASYDNYRGALLEQNDYLQEHLSGRSLFDLYEEPEEEKRIFGRKIERARRAIFRVVRAFSRFGSGIDFLMGSVWIFAALTFTWVGGGPGNFVAFSLWGTILFRPIIELADRFNTLLSGLASLKKVKKILQEEEEVDLGKDSIEKVEEIEFKNVSFHYNKENPVLKNISFKTEGSVGLVGLTGAGKTTLLSLLLRFYHPLEGEILVNGSPHTSFKLDDLRKALFTLLQDPLVLRASLEENLNLYSHQPASGESIVHGLSEGEKQLLALDRALIASPNGLLLDEATSSLDLATEKEVENKIKTLLTDRIAIVVAHRLSTLRSLDKIILLDEGKIVEEGSFSALLEKKGLFYQLWKLLSTKEP